MPKLDVSKYPENQQLAAQLIATRDINQMTNQQIASEAGVDPRTIYRWMNNEEFLELLNYYADLSQDAFLPELYAHMRKAVRGGSTRAMELVLKSKGKLIDRKEVTGNIELEAKASLSEDAILAEIEELKRKIEDQKHILPELPELKEDD